MKNIWIYFLLVVSLSACASSSSGHEGCSIDGRLCIGMQIEEPNQFGDVNIVTITVSSLIDIDNLKIYIGGATPHNIQFEDITGWSDLTISWTIDIKANQPQYFTRNFLLPEQDGYFQIITHAFSPRIRAIYSLYIHQQQSGSLVYYENTPIPYTKPFLLPTIGPELLQTLEAIPTRTPFPVITRIPTFTWTPIPPAYPPPASPTSPPMEGPGEEPYP